MTDQPVHLPETIDAATSIPPAPAGVKPKKVKAARPAGDPFVPTVATFPDPFSAPPNPTAAAPAASIIKEPIMATTPDTFGENVVENITEKVHAFTADMDTRAEDAMEKGTRFLADVNGFTKDNVEALVESGKIAVSGVQTMAQDQAAYVRRQFEEAAAAARTLAGVKSPTEFVKLQGDYVRQQFDGAIAEMSRSTEAMLKLAGQVVQPISNRVAVAVEKIKLAA